MPSETSITAVATVFDNVFGRAPTSQESSGWATQLDSGSTAAQLARALADSPEGAANVSALYQQILGRGLTSVSSSEIASGQAYLAQDKTNGLAGLRASMASSAEAQADIKAVYQNVLGRAASGGEVTSAEAALTNGATLAQFYTSAAAAPELAANLTAAYKGTFGTAPSASALSFLRQQIVSGATFSNVGSALSSQAAHPSSASSTNGSLPDTFNPAESLLSSGAASSAAPTNTTTSTAAGAASLVQLTNPATAGIMPVLHGS